MKDTYLSKWLVFAYLPLVPINQTFSPHEECLDDLEQNVFTLKQKKTYQNFCKQFEWT